MTALDNIGVPPGEASTSQFVRHIPCPSCGSGDANSLYDDGHTHCFACDSTVQNPEGAPEEGPPSPALGLIDGRPMALSARGITRQTCRTVGYLGGTFNGEPVHIAQYYDGKRVVAQKIRTADKRFTILGDMKSAGLFGQHLWRDTGGKRLVITEGEIDALSVLQAFDCRWPVVSLRNGASGALKDVRQHLDFIESYDEIVLWFDSDEPGQRATEAVASVLTPGKVRVARLFPDQKDANDVLRNLGVAEVVRGVYESRTYRPDGIIQGSEILTEVDRFYDEGFAGVSYSSPYDILNARFGGFRKGELYVYTAGSGIGKSTLLRELGYHWLMVHGLKLGYIALEENTLKTGLGFMSIHLNTPLHLTREGVTRDAYLRASRQILDNNRLYLCAHWGSMGLDDLMKRLRYLALGAQVDFIVLDHISIAISGLEIADERKAIDVLMTNLRTLCEQTGVGIHAITHLRKADSKKRAAEDGGRISLADLRGSGSLYQLADGVIAVVRNPTARDETKRHISRLEALKNRFSGDTGPCDTLMYDKATGRLQATTEEFAEEEEGTHGAGERPAF